MAILHFTAEEAGTELTVWEPDQLTAGCGRAKSLWLLHGMGGNDGEWFEKTSVLNYVNRNEVYIICPAAQSGFYTDCPAGENWETRIMGTAWDFIHERFELPERREDTAVAGFSMGGYGAMRYGLFYPERFGYIGSFAGGVNVPQRYAEGENIMGLLGLCFGPADKVVGSEYDLYKRQRELAASEAVLPRVFMAVGWRDPHENGPNQEFRDSLRSSGYEVSWDEGDYGHTWEFVDVMLKEFLENW